MKYGIMIGSNIFIGTSGILNLETIDGNKEFFKIRELQRIRSKGSYIVVDCDIKEPNGNRIV